LDHIADWSAVLPTFRQNTRDPTKTLTHIADRPAALPTFRQIPD